jgi:hypothetical protein
MHRALRQELDLPQVQLLKRRTLEGITAPLRRTGSGACAFSEHIEEVAVCLPNELDVLKEDTPDLRSVYRALHREDEAPPHAQKFRIEVIAGGQPPSVVVRPQLVELALARRLRIPHQPGGVVIA